MKLEVRCPSCGRGYLVDESRIPTAGGKVACTACGAAIDLARTPGVAPAISGAPSPGEPPEAAPAPSDATRPVARDDGERRDEVVCPRCGLHFNPANARPDPTGAARPTVLVVEDMEYFREIAKEALSSRYEVRTATSLREAHEALRSSRVDAILLDLTLHGGENGLSLLRDLRPKPCPVVIYTAEDETELYGESWDRLRALGADDLVLKGMNVGESLVRKIGALLGETEENEPVPR